MNTIEAHDYNQLTVRNENLFSMMKHNINREQPKDPSKKDLTQIMCSLETYKNKRRDPRKRVKVPYYHKVISRSRHKQSLSAAANPD